MLVAWKIYIDGIDSDVFVILYHLMETLNCADNEDQILLPSEIADVLFNPSHLVIIVPRRRRHLKGRAVFWTCR